MHFEHLSYNEPPQLAIHWNLVVVNDHLQLQESLWTPRECNFPWAAVEPPPWLFFFLFCQFFSFGLDNHLGIENFHLCILYCSHHWMFLNTSSKWAGIGTTLPPRPLLIAAFRSLDLEFRLWSLCFHFCAHLFFAAKDISPALIIIIIIKPTCGQGCRHIWEQRDSACTSLPCSWDDLETFKYFCVLRQW